MELRQQMAIGTRSRKPETTEETSKAVRRDTPAFPREGRQACSVRRNLLTVWLCTAASGRAAVGVRPRHTWLWQQGWQ